MCAAEFGLPTVVTLLAEAKCDVNAIISPTDRQQQRLVLDAPPGPQQKPMELTGATQLILAAAWGKLQSVNELLIAKANMSHAADDGMSALLAA